MPSPTETLRVLQPAAADDLVRFILRRVREMPALLEGPFLPTFDQLLTAYVELGVRQDAEEIVEGGDDA